MWILSMNDMRFGNYENIVPVARAESKEALEKFIETHKCETYWDGKWGKSFKKDSSLEWFNITSAQFSNAGTLDEWIAEAIKRFNYLKNSVINVEA